MHQVGSSSKLLYQIWIGGCFAMEGGHFSIFPAVACNIYGAQLGSKVYSLLFIGTALASFIGLLVANLILPIFGWSVVFMFFSLVCLTSLLLLLLFEEKPSINDSQDVRDYYKLMTAEEPYKVIFKSSGDTLKGK